MSDMFYYEATPVDDSVIEEEEEDTEYEYNEPFIIDRDNDRPLGWYNK